VVRAVTSGDAAPANPPVSYSDPTPLFHPELLKPLTPAEREVVLKLCEGLSNREIARILGKRESTVKFQLTQIYRKLEVDSRARLIARLRS
jgi:DNA-binding CsgD family transcriptional regulator